MAGLTRSERLQIMLSAVELEAVDNWRFARRMPTRAAAVRELLRRGLKSEGFEIAQAGAKSRDFHVLDETAMGGQAGRKRPGDSRPDGN